LTPYRSLGPTGFLILMAFVGGVSFVTGIVFMTKGAWPVFGFFGLDVLAVYLAFRWSYRSARAYEEVHVGRDLVLIRRVDPRGRMQEYRFNPFWLRLEIDRHEEAGTTAIRLKGRGRRLVVGSFLNPTDKESFAEALSAALAAARSGNVPA
ncbi:MAG: DUF2244 domain-containing protein, partial [Hyphomicrobiales bacterium]|nr:DUF2244 domain-containing protein [Hyphomicrobiales bacterium]